MAHSIDCYRVGGGGGGTHVISTETLHKTTFRATQPFAGLRSPPLILKPRTLVVYVLWHTGNIE